MSKQYDPSKDVIITLDNLKRFKSKIEETVPDELADLSDDETHRLVTDTEIASWDDGAKNWVGTQAEYEAAKDTIAEGTRVYITDDTIDTPTLNNYYTKEEVDSKLSIVPMLTIEVVDSLDDVTSPSTTVIYLVPGESGSGVMFKEYVYTHDTWRLIGTQTTLTTSVDDNTGKLYLNT